MKTVYIVNEETTDAIGCWTCRKVVFLSESDALEYAMSCWEEIDFNAFCFESDMWWCLFNPPADANPIENLKAFYKTIADHYHRRFPFGLDTAEMAD